MSRPASISSSTSARRAAALPRERRGIMMAASCARGTSADRTGRRRAPVGRNQVPVVSPNPATAGSGPSVPAGPGGDEHDAAGDEQAGAEQAEVVQVRAGPDDGAIAGAAAG